MPYASLHEPRVDTVCWSIGDDVAGGVAVVVGFGMLVSTNRVWTQCVGA